jgi:micrococcal nuclease
MYEYKINEVVKVVDGDTLDVVFDVGFSMFCKQRVRLLGLDTPETHTSNEREKKMGLEAKAFVNSWISGQKGLIGKTTKDDKYGRILAMIYGDGGVCLNDELVSKGYAWLYDGGTKHKDLDALDARQHGGVTGTISVTEAVQAAAAKQVTDQGIAPMADSGATG